MVCKAAKIAKRKPGRPAGEAPPMVQLAIRIPRPMLEAIDAEVAARFDQPDRTAVIRELLADALKSKRPRI